MSFQGFLYVDKPAGWTSFDVVNYVRRIVAEMEGRKPRNVKVGHTGTLDPEATGLLVLCVGKDFTRQVPDLIRHEKTYKVELTLGKNSDTGDREGEIVEVSSNVPEQDSVKSVILSFIGESMQVPPAFSAIKIDGVRAYKLARGGSKVEIPARKINIQWIKDVEYVYPIVSFETRVGSGTYIRSLAVDIGEKLEVGAYMSDLRRTSVGDISIESAVKIADINREFLEKHLS